MFMYIKKGHYGAQFDDIVNVATIDKLLDLCKEGYVERVIIPMTYSGYGESLIDTSNRRSIQRDYAANRFKVYQGHLTVSAYQFKKYEGIRELIETLQEKYPIYDETDYSLLEMDTLTEFIVDELTYAHIRDDNFPELDRAEVERVLFDTEHGDRIDYWEYAFIEGGDTPAIQDKDFETLKAQFLERWAILPMGDTAN